MSGLPHTGPVVVAGASGFMGRFLVEHWRASGREVRTVGRGAADARWGDTDGIRRLLDGSALLVNLAGKSVNCRYGPQNRAEILRSRVETTNELARAVAGSASPPAVWINSSTATIYRHAEDRPQTESTGELGTGFSVSIAKAWEEAFFAAEAPATRRVAIRTAIVLGDGSALVPLLNLARFGLGGPQWDTPWFSTRARREAGTQHEFRARWGRQMFSWIHLADVAGALDLLEERDELSGAVNLAAPHPVTGVELMREVRSAVGMPFGIPAPRPVLEVGAWMIGTETELLLKSRWVLPERLLAAGYVFRYPELRAAIRDIVAERRGVR
ncbi:MAG: NAD-dependent epimerase [Leifsonia xyli]|nr:MAG: NAD-dependent epimerase [Leifsonia xyli]